MSWNSMWDDVFEKNEWGKYPPESLIRFIARNFYKKERKSVRLLEVGCGPAANVWYMAREGFEAFGIDGSAVAIEKAKSRFISENLTASLIVGDIVNLPYQDSYFDAVIDIECLYCNSIESSLKILQEIKRVLKPQGMFFSRTFSSDIYIGENPTSINSMEFRDIKEGPLKGNQFVRLSTKETIRELYGREFSVESIDKEQYTMGNGEVLVSEWNIICRKGN